MANKRPSGSPPLFIVLGLCLLVVGLLQLGNLAFLFQQDGPFANPAVTEMFADLPQAKAAEQQRELTNLANAQEQATPSFVNTPTYATRHDVIDLPRQENNPVLGALRGRVVVTIFANYCSPELAGFWKLLEPHTHGVSTVVKYIPPQPNAMDAGMLMQLAARQGYFDAYWQKLCETGAKDLVDQVQALERAGMGLAKQRAAMAMHINGVLDELNADITLAEQHGITGDVPTIFINGIKIGTKGLPFDQISLYLEQALAGLPLG